MSAAPDLSAIVHEHQAGVWKYLRVLGCDSHEADELTQATFVDVLRKGFEYQGPAQTAAFLRTKARFLYLSHRRTQAKHPTLQEYDALDQVFDEYQHHDSGNAYDEALQRCLDQLDERARHLIDLQYRDDLEGDEIARVLGISKSNVKTIAHRARTTLKECIEQRLAL